MKKLLAASLLAIGCWTGSAQAATTISFDPTGALAAGTRVYQNFDGFASGTSIAPGVNVYAADAPGVAAQPEVGTTGNYAAVQAGGNYTTTFAASNLFSFVLGSLDSYNNLILRYADNSTTQLFGDQIIGNLPFASAMANGTVTYNVTSGPLLTGATFGTAVNSFEFDNLATAVPEPAAWIMMILGFGLVGGVLRRRSTAKVSFA